MAFKAPWGEFIIIQHCWDASKITKITKNNHNNNKNFNSFEHVTTKQPTMTIQHRMISSQQMKGIQNIVHGNVSCEDVADKQRHICILHSYAHSCHVQLDLNIFCASFERLLKYYNYCILCLNISMVIKNDRIFRRNIGRLVNFVETVSKMTNRIHMDLLICMPISIWNNFFVFFMLSTR